MQISTRQRDKVTILDLKGKITIGAGDIVLREAVQAELAAGKSEILINLKNASRMDSSGMAELVHANSSVGEAGGHLKLVNLPSKIQDVLGITQLITIFETFDDEDEAVASFSS